MGAVLKGPNALLRRLRSVMAEQLAPQDRLNQIVNDIAVSTQHIGRANLRIHAAC